MAQLKDLPIDSMVIFHSYVMLVYQRVIGKMMIHHWIDFGASYFQSISTFNAFNVGILQIFVQFRAAFPCQWLIKVGTRSKTTSRVVQICPSPRRRCTRRGAVGRRGPVVGCYASEGDVFLRDVASMNVPFPLVGWLVESSLHSTTNR